jgi:nicotinamide riboside transporter PnuC
VIAWTLTAFSLLGNYFVNKKNIKGQWIWLIVDVIWFIHFMILGQYAEAFLFGAYGIFCVHGIISWSKKDLTLSPSWRPNK